MKLFLIGAGGHARVCADVIKQESRYQLAGLVGVSSEVGQVRFGYEVIASDDELDSLALEYRHAFIGIGQIKSPALRIKMHQQLLELRINLPVIVSPTAYVAPGVSLGAGTIVMHGAIINSGASVGENCIINTRAVVEHDSVVSDHCHISTGVIINGDGRVGEGTFIGSGSVINEGVSIGGYSIVASSSSIKDNLPDKSKRIGHIS